MDGMPMAGNTAVYVKAGAILRGSSAIAVTID